MARLEWDKDSERLYETGVDHVALYLLNANSNYETGIVWNGITGVTESPDGADANDIYADNIKYLSLISKENWKGTIKAYTYPKEFNACMGQHELSGLSAFFGQQTRQKFGLTWRSLMGNDVLGDKFGFKLHLAWALSAAPSEMDHATQNDSPEAQEFSWELSSIPPKATKKIWMYGDKSVATNEKEIQPCSHVVVNSMIYDKTQEKYIHNDLYDEIEDKVHGYESGVATLPKLDQLINFLRTGSWS